MSKFINESIHPRARSLLNRILSCTPQEKGDAGFYYPLQFWGKAKGVSDEKLSDLHARLEEAHPRGSFFAIPDALRIHAISEALWANDKAVVSLSRGYVIRRWFNKYIHRLAQKV